MIDCVQLAHSDKFRIDDCITDVCVAAEPGEPAHKAEVCMFLDEGGRSQVPVGEQGGVKWAMDMKDLLGSTRPRCVVTVQREKLRESGAGIHVPHVAEHMVGSKRGHDCRRVAEGMGERFETRLSDGTALEE